MRGVGIVWVLVFATSMTSSAWGQDVWRRDTEPRIQPIQAETPIASFDSLSRDEWIRLIDQRIAQSQAEAPMVDPPLAPGPLNSGPQFAQDDVDAGAAAFWANCTACHDADRAFEKQKTYSGWLATVRRMAAMDDADIPANALEPIATYLASLSPGGGGSVGDARGSSDAPAQTTAIYGTISPLWRGSSGEHLLESPDFFVDAWAGAEWQPSGPISAKVTACTSCHSTETAGFGSAGFTLELVEASATLDLTQVWRDYHCIDDDCEPLLKSNLKAGRFVVPFGAFAAMSHPGRIRTVSNPLMFNMGRRVGPVRPLQPVLPMPYADEGADLHVNLAISSCWTATFDVYAVNGLQAQNAPMIFNSSRRYVDNNREPALGGRVTIGNKSVRFGASAMSGNLADDGLNTVLYKVAGVDATARIHDRFRFYFEYAIREDSLFLANADENQVYGIVAELEATLFEKIGLLARYDTLEHRHAVFGDSTTERFTYGINVAMPAGSWLMINHEHWMFGTTDDDVVGLRWTATF